MRTFFGMILGCLLTIAVFYVHDSMATSNAATNPTGSSARTIVNWDVAAFEWGKLQDGVRMAWAKLTTSSNG